MRGLDCQAGLWLQGKGRGHVCSNKYRMYNGMLSAIKRTKSFAVAVTWMDLEILMLSQVSQGRTNT